MSSRTQSHQLNNGLYVSGRPGINPISSRTPTMPSRALPYTCGDVTKSGELAKMFDLTSSQPPSRPSSGPNSRSGPQPVPSRLSSSVRVSRKSSGPLPLHPTGLITSGPLTSSGGGVGPRRSGQMDGQTGQGGGKMVYRAGGGDEYVEGEGEVWGESVEGGNVGVWDSCFDGFVGWSVSNGGG